MSTQLARYRATETDCRRLHRSLRPTRRSADVRLARRSILRCGPVGLLFVGIGLVACQSNGLVVESVNDYTTGGNWGAGANLSNSIANGDGFIKAMTPPDSEWKLTYRFTDRNVWDTDFSQGDNWDALYFDKPGTAISYYTGHGLTTAYDEVPEHPGCRSSSECTKPPSGASPPGVCKAAGSPNYAPGDVPRCVYYSDQ